MKRGKYLVVIFICVGGWLLAGCGACRREPGREEFSRLTIFGARDTLLPGEMALRTVAVAVHEISVPTAAGLPEKVNMLADSLSALRFNGLEIEVLEITQDSVYGLLLKVNLAEDAAFSGPGSLPPYRSWYDFFQGSAGGLETTITLRATFLQPGLYGEWVDAVAFYYQGKPFANEEWAHVVLQGQIARNNYAP
ncbi:MAG TPA: hypothetical protein DCM62_09830 [Bacteroidales bacterium]|nr:hypothetical protein [Bacteroidales bacterium]